MNPTEQEKKVEAAEKEPKPLPAMVSPTVNLAEEIRQVVAVRCREKDESFSVKTNQLWIVLLKQEKLIPADLEVDLTPKRGGGAVQKEKIEAQQTEIDALKKQLADLKAAKK